ncbi:MAG: hypothetical protein H6838_17610 [Planctomycetes bacterium]|nr:hypothetical protein [Planctomycetota bacterium]
MRNSLLLSLSLSLACGLAAQSPLSTGLAANNQGNNGGGLYFDLQINTTVTLTQIDSWVGTNGLTAGNLALELWLGPTTYVGNVTNAALWTAVETATATNYVPNATVYQLLSFTFNNPVTLGPGNYGVALKSQSIAPAGTQVWNHGYVNGLTCTSTSIPGSCSNTVHSNAEMTIRGGAAQNAFLSGGIFTPRMWGGNLHYTNGGTPISIAAWENYGDGCNKGRTSFHELFPNPIGWDLSGQTGVPTTGTITLGLGSGYTVTSGGSPFTPPSATAAQAVLTSGNETFLASTVLGAPLTVPILYPDGTAIGFADDLEICTDGYVTPILNAAPVSNPRAAPTVAGLYSGEPRWAPYWKDIDPFTMGNITVEITAANDLVVSWNGVADPTGATTPYSFQIAFLATGSVEYRYDGNNPAGGGGSYPILVGYSTGHNALDNEMDLSLALTAGFQTSIADSQELTQIMSARPRLGTTPNFVAEHAPAGTAFGISLMSFVQLNPGVSLSPFGAPGCFQYMGAEVTQAIFVINNGSFVQPFPIPSNIAFNGTIVLSQSACLTPGANQLGALFSNGTRMLIGSL